MRKCPTVFSEYLRAMVVCGIVILIAWSAQGQGNSGNSLREHFTRYQENAFQEKIFVHTSKDNFFIGENMFLKIYTVDAMLHHPSNLNVVAYLEILNSNNQPVAQIKVPLKNGMGSSSLLIPDTLSTGRYRVISYTSWMRNFSPDFFFSKDISVINPLKKASITKKQLDAKPSIQFFPEGGNLVYGIHAKVAFQVTGLNGRGLDFKGAVIDDRNDTLIRFQPLKFGIGNFSFTPQKGRIYRVLIQTKEGTGVKELPVPDEEGYGMSLVAEESKSRLVINVRSNVAKASGTEINLFLHSRQRIRKMITGVLSDSGYVRFTIPGQELEDGISHFTLFDQNLKPLAERLYFKQPDQLLRIQANVAQPIYARRETAAVTLGTKDWNGQPLAANLSLSLYKIDAIQGCDSVNIISYLLLTSDLKGNIENPSYYLSQTGADVRQAIDNLMLTHGWSRFTWSDILKDKWPLTPFNPDHEGMTIRAKIADDQETPIGNANVLLSATSKAGQLYAGMSNAKGLLSFYSRNLYGKNDILLQQVGKSSKINFTLINSFSESYPSKAFNSYTVSRAHEKLVRSYSIHSQVQKGFTPHRLMTSVGGDSIPIYGRPDKTFLLSDYVEFPILKDVLAEYVFEVIVRKQDNKFHLFTLDKVTNQFFENEPLILIDGVPVFDSDRIVNLPANLIKKLDVLNKKIFYGPFVFNGIVSLTSHTGQFSGVQVNPEAVAFDYDGLQWQQEFYSPVYPQPEPSEDRLPDFRNVLLWNPEINTDVSGKVTLNFTTSDLPGQFIGVVNGLTASGLPGSVTFMVEVK